MQVGDPVIGFLPFVDDGAAAEYVVAAAAGLAPAPSSIPFTDAAALPWSGSPPGRHSSSTRASRPGSGSSSTAPAVRSEATPCSWPRPPAPTSSPRRVQTPRSGYSHGADEVVDYTAGDVSAWVSEPVDVLLNLAPIVPSSSPRWRAGSVTEGSSSTPPCGCPPRPTRTGACAVSTCTSAATPPSWPSCRPRRPRRAHRRRRRARPDGRPRQRPHPRRRRNPHRQGRRCH